MKTTYIVATVVCLLVCIVGFGIADMVIYSQGKAFYSSSEACGVFPSNLTSFSAEKKLWSQWNWKYAFTHFDGKIEQNCPTLRHDVNVYAGGKLVMRSDGKFATFVSKTLLKDCHGNVKYISRTGSAFQTFVNGFKIDVSFELKDGEDKNILAYVDGSRFFSDSFQIKNASGTVVATLTRNKFSYPWTWQFNLAQQGQAGSDPAVLGLLAGKLAFSDGDGSDSCNGFFYNVAWALLAVAIFTVCVSGCFAYFLWDEFKGECGSCCRSLCSCDYTRVRREDDSDL